MSTPDRPAESQEGQAPAPRDRIDFLMDRLRSTEGVECEPSPMGVLIRMGRIFETVEEMLETVVRNEHVRHKKDHDLLVALLQSDKPLKNNELEILLRLKSASVSQRVGRLIEAGMIDRTPAPTDTRANQLSITEMGREVTIASINKALLVQQRVLESAFAAQDIAIIEELLRRLNHSLGDAPSNEQLVNMNPT